MREFQLGHLAGLRLSARPSALVSFVGLWAALSGLAALWLEYAFGTALWMGLLATVLHTVSEIIHQLGHAWAARRTGYPMQGIRLWGPLSTSVYPADEPALPGPVHIRRALGGPLFSLLLALAAGVITLLLPRGPLWWVSLFCFGENLLVFAGQVFLPLGFNDGATIWHWWQRQRQQG